MDKPSFSNGNASDLKNPKTNQKNLRYKQLALL